MSMIDRFVPNSYSDIVKEYADNARQVRNLCRQMRYAESVELVSYLSGILSIRKQYSRDLGSLMDLRAELIKAGF